MSPAHGRLLFRRLHHGQHKNTSAGGTSCCGSVGVVVVGFDVGAGAAGTRSKCRDLEPAIMKACREDGMGRGTRAARCNGAVSQRGRSPGWGRGWGSREFGCGRTQRRCAGVIDAAGLSQGETGEDSLDDQASSLCERHFRGVSMCRHGGRIPSDAGVGRRRFGRDGAKRQGLAPGVGASGDAVLDGGTEESLQSVVGFEVEGSGLVVANQQTLPFEGEGEAGGDGAQQALEFRLGRTEPRCKRDRSSSHL